MSFRQADLSIDADELNELSARLTNIPDAVDKAVESWDATVRRAAARYSDVPENLLKRLWNACVIWDLYSQVPGEIPANRQKAYDEAMKEINRLRDGKATEYSLVENTSTTNAGASWGGEKQF